MNPSVWEAAWWEPIPEEPQKQRKNVATFVAANIDEAVAQAKQWSCGIDLIHVAQICGLSEGPHDIYEIRRKVIRETESESMAAEIRAKANRMNAQERKEMAVLGKQLIEGKEKSK